MIEIRHLSKKYKNNVVLDDISLSVEEGKVLSIIGPSGTGKSTFLRCLNQLEVPERGELEMDGKVVDLSKKNRAEITGLRRKTGMVFQKFNLFEKKTALENVMEGLVTVRKMDKAKAKKIAEEELDKVGMLSWKNHYPKQLSGGQQQRVAIARALAMKPELLLLDEPTSALDPELVGEVLDTIKRVASEGLTMILVSHEMSFVRNVSHRVIFLDHGHIVENGTPSEVFDHPKNERTREFFAKMNKIEQPEYII